MTTSPDRTNTRSMGVGIEVRSVRGGVVSKAAGSVFLFDIYVVGLGLVLIVAPNALLLSSAAPRRTRSGSAFWAC
jgi:hypothetical protein